MCRPGLRKNVPARDGAILPSRCKTASMAKGLRVGLGFCLESRLIFDMLSNVRIFFFLGLTCPASAEHIVNKTGLRVCIGPIRMVKDGLEAEDA